MSLRDDVVGMAESQLGVRYWTMHQGPRGSGSEGFGCAMLCAWCLNEVLGTDYYGSCWNFWGDAIGAPTYNQGGSEFVVTDDPKPGDVVLYFNPNANIGYSTEASHAALYVGDGMVIGSYGYGTPGTDYYMDGGNVRLTSVAYQSLGGPIRYVSCVRLGDDYEEDDTEMSQRITTLGVNIRDKPSTRTGNIVGYYPANSEVIIDRIILEDGYAWGHYVGQNSGKDRYIALGSTEYVK